MPYYPEGTSKAYYENKSIENKIVSDYANLSIPETEEIDVFTFWGLLHDAVVWNYSRTEEGRNHLENAWVFEQTKPDRNALRNKFGGIKKNGEQKA